MTPRQRQVAALVAEGKTYRQVGDALGMATRTVKYHVATIALHLPNPDNLPAKLLVTLWAAHKQWECPAESSTLKLSLWTGRP